MEGWIKLHRRIMDNPLWSEDPFTRGQAWVDMILLANHKPGYIYVRGNKVTIDRGQIGWSIVKLSKRWRWSRDKVRRFLNDLESEQQIRQQKNNVTSIITIVKYEDYQSSDTAEYTANETQTGHRQVTNKNVKNVKKEREGVSSDEISSQQDTLSSPSLELAQVPVEKREPLITEILQPLQLSDTELEMYLSKIGSARYQVQRGKNLIPLTVESVYHDARLNKLNGYLEPRGKAEAEISSSRNFTIL